MKLKLAILGISILSFTVGCEKKMDRIFEESPTERLNISIANVYSTLQANKDGWLVKYYPSKAMEFGGYTLFTKFTNSTDVVVEGDMTTLAAQTSTYAVIPGAGPILSFDTYNRIFHFFALPQYFNKEKEYQLPGFISDKAGIGASNEGMKGENDFLVTKVSSDSVVLEARRSYNKVVLLPIKSSEAGTILNAYRAAVAKFHPMGGYKFEVGTESINATFATAATKRALLIAGTSAPFAYRYTPTGLDFYTEYDIKGVKFKELKYVEPGGSYTKGYFTNEAGTVKLVPTT
ncbi:DUF4302 domain-containing protein [Sphingobacterium paucimobilis]|uniref:DUF4302 domain-containing protein n=1 Tax=Sphingobacterium paucimobilis HER1398 TaxID=1346330 RepID=U2J8C1_9SPHI|nr:DUF4302 domain-containing protein [Sphingobacterium paucimobilis]ERJ61164.1 hypothetical protein M472_20645 [Sphingobacterium paucimobilis HER1398]